MTDLYSPSRQILPGDYTRLGAHWDGEGTNFALFSDHATRVELCLFDETGQQELHRVEHADRVLRPIAGAKHLQLRRRHLLGVLRFQEVGEFL